MNRDDLGTSIGEMTLMLDGMHFSKPFQDPLFWEEYDQDIAYQENVERAPRSSIAPSKNLLESDAILDFFK